MSERQISPKDEPVWRPRLMVIIASTRPGRVGLPVGQWFAGQAEAQGDFVVQVVDLAELNLPFMDEPNHPRLRAYTQQHTKDWSAMVDAADAFVLVTPEYNHSFPGPLKAAIDSIYDEWALKAVAFVSYGGVSGGLRAVEALRPVFAELHAVTIRETVSFAQVWDRFAQDGSLTDPALADAAADRLLDQLAWWASVLKAGRQQGTYAS